MPRLPRSLPALGLLIGAALAILAGCDDLSGYRTGADEVFAGEVVGIEEDSFIRRGFPPETSLELTFDPSRADVPEPGPGSLTSSDGSFTETPLLPISSLAHDVLSDYDFPGDGRLRNYIFTARPSEGPIAGRDAMIFLSLLANGRIEARVIAGTGRDEGDRYGLFRLEKQRR